MTFEERANELMIGKIMKTIKSGRASIVSMLSHNFTLRSH